MPLQTKTIDGTWNLTIDSQLGKEDIVVDIATQPDGSVGGHVRNVKTGDTEPMAKVEIDSETLTWHQRIRRPMKLTLVFTMTLDNDDQMSGIAKPRMMPGVATVVGQRVS